jgi:hypothetical protein
MYCFNTDNLHYSCFKWDLSATSALNKLWWASALCHCSGIALLGFNSGSLVVQFEHGWTWSVYIMELPWLCVVPLTNVSHILTASLLFRCCQDTRAFPVFLKVVNHNWWIHYACDYSFLNTSFFLIILKYRLTVFSAFWLFLTELYSVIKQVRIYVKR